jgi:hypothetical protein
MAGDVHESCEVGPVKDLTELLLPVWKKERGASEKAIARAETHLGVSLPEDYRKFLRWSNGGDGKLGNRSIRLEPVGLLWGFNDDYQIPRFFPGVIGIGTDRGDYAYVLDFRKSDKKFGFGVVELGALSDKYVERLGDTFREGMLRMLEGK